MKDVSIALVQLENTKDIDDNCRKICSYIEGAGNVDIICFPEACLTGYSTEDPLSISADDIHVKNIIDIANKNGIIAIFGFLEKIDDHIFVTQIVADPDGKTMFYRKTHLGGREARSFSEGDYISVLKTEKVTIGLQLCWEAHIPDISTTLRGKGAEIIFMPHSIKCPAERRRRSWMKYVPARAYDNGIYVCALNCISGKDTGGMIVFDRFGDVVSEDFSGVEGMKIVDLPALPEPNPFPKSMKEASYFLRRRPELYK